MPKIHEIKKGPLTITYNFYEVITQDLMIIGSNVEKELEDLPVQYSYYQGILVLAKRLLDEASRKLEQYKAGVRNQKREEGVKLTAAAGEDLVNSLPGAVELHNKVLDCQETYGYAKGICNAFEVKRDMLVQLSVNNRQEARIYQQ